MSHDNDSTVDVIHANFFVFGDIYPDWHSIIHVKFQFSKAGIIFIVAYFYKFYINIHLSRNIVVAGLCVLGAGVMGMLPLILRYRTVFCII